MVKINEIARTSTFAWNSDNLPLLATGTVAGAVDINFSSSSTLEIWDTFSPTNNKEPIFTAPVENRFYAIAWSKPFENYSKGLIVGAFENGIVEFWDAEKLIKSKNLEDSSIHKSNKHTGAVKSLQFNPIQNHVLVTGGSNGQIFIWDCKSFNDPFNPGQAMTPMDEITSVSWNNSVSHILASTGNGGYTSVWDLKAKREVLHLSYTSSNGNRANFSYVAWHPTKSTKLITASDNDSCPVILTWDLRNSNAPEQILNGHKKGVLSLDWCKQDSNLLLSSGKDNSTLLWNPIEGVKLGEYPTTANWAFETKFAPSVPDIFATASFDGKIVIQTLQDTSPPATNKVSASNDDNEFWSELSTTDTQQPQFEVKQAPQWLNNPVSVSFGFGSKLVTVKKDSNGKSIINISKFVAKGQEETNKLFESLKNENYSEIIDEKLKGKTINDNNKSDWEVLKKLSENGKDSFFKTEEKVEKNGKEPKEEKKEAQEAQEDGEDFFAHLGNGETKTKTEAFVPSGNFKIFSKSESEDNKKLISLILNNKIEEAVNTCLDQKKLLEALILALDGTDEIKQQVKTAYFKKNKEDNLSRILYNVSSKNVTDLVANANVENWKEIALGITSFTTDSDEYNNKMTELGDRILQSDKKGKSRDDAITCYLAGGALDKIANVWLKELPDYEEKLLKDDDSITSFSDARLQSLTNFVEKIATYRYITKTTSEISGPSAEPISKAILEFVNLIAGAGEFDLANKFLQLIPSEFGSNEKERILKATGVEKAPVNKTAPAATNVKAKSSRAPSYQPANITQPSIPSIQQQRLRTAYNQPTVTPQQQYPSFQAPTPGIQPSAPKTNPYARSNPYAPTNIYKAASPITQNTTMNQPLSNSIPPPPPRKLSKSETEGWNDLPDTFKPKVTAPRRAAAAATSSPSPAPPLSQFPSQTSLNQAYAPPPNNPTSTGPPPPPTKRSISTNQLPPPPKSGSRSQSKANVASSSVTSSPKVPPAVSNRYAPPPGSEQQPLQPPTSSSSFSGPISQSPRSIKKNPYAPTHIDTPSNKFTAPPTPQQLNSGPVTPAAQTTKIPKNPYAPPANINQQSINPAGIAPPPPKLGAAPPPQQSFGTINSQPIQPAFNGVAPPPPRPMTSSSNASIKSQPPAQQTSAAPPPPPESTKHPKGDRSHIPESSKPIYESLNKVLEAIKPSIPEKYAKHGVDMENRLNILFDNLNNETLSSGLINDLKNLSSSLENKDFTTSSGLNVEIATNYSDELGQWHTGLKRLITMAEAMY
ncbi:unnamed protein product [Candida verbasci]|uniref:Protein transport protein SEC31 n=1 Tax=Candida verbasci TaxID=1227364 RepID=A0A9W4XCK8_9ASCO|nr:unnamed protein product [Candida verbasci]